MAKGSREDSRGVDERCMMGYKKIVRRVRQLLPLPSSPIIKQIDGVRYELDLTEEIERALYFGLYETEVTALLRRYIGPSMVVFEVGANIGAHTFSIARMLKNGKLFSFEPTTYAFGKLRRNVSLNTFNNIVIEKIALSDVAEDRVISSASSSDTMPFKASWNVGGGTKNRSVETIHFETLDHYVLKNQLDRVDFIKIDTDGYEMKVLRGGIATIKKFRPMMLIEAGHLFNRGGDSLDQFIALIGDLGYDIHSKYDYRHVGLDEFLQVCAKRRADDFLFIGK